MKGYQLLITGLILCQAAFSQKKVLDHDDYKVWRNIDNREISNNGKYIAYDIVHQEDGDPTIFLHDQKGTLLLSYVRGADPRFTNDSKYVLFTIHPDQHDVKELRRIKTKKEDLPKDSLGIYNLSTGELLKVPDLIGYKLPEKWNAFAFIQIDPKVKQDTTKKKPKKSSKKNGYPLLVYEFGSGSNDTLKYVTSYAIAREGQSLGFVTTGIDSVSEAGAYIYNFENRSAMPAVKGKGKFESLTWDEPGNQFAFVFDTTSAKNALPDFRLWLGSDASGSIVDANAIRSLSADWKISEHRRLTFSKNSEFLYFGTNPPPLQEDTLVLKEEKVNVEIWSYTDQKLHTQQKVDSDADKKMSYLAAVNVQSKDAWQIASADMETSLVDEGNAPFVLAQVYNPYRKTVSWEGYPMYRDVLTIDVRTGTETLVASKVRGNVSVSPKGKYLIWYAVADSAWFTYNVSSKVIRQITSDEKVMFYNEQNNYPNYPYPYGLASWTENDSRVLIYDRYDIWEVDPEGVAPMKNLTVNGRSQKTRYRYLRLDPDERFVGLKQKLILSVFNESTKNSGFALLTPGKGVKELLGGPAAYRRLKKARDADQVIFSRESFTDYPEVHSSTLAFKSSTRISTTNPQQSEYNWGSIELVHWTSLDGTPLEGYVIKPENFDSSKKYPMMVYFYERSSDGINNHVMPAPNSTVINKTFYASRGYVVFVPNIEYRIGYPGESAYDCVIPGVTKLIEEGFVDKDRIGVQGQSWGGYQIAYLITKTDIFAAAESGAPVSNMTSAYGGIRWGSGLSRMFQYEHTQSRIGGTLWDYPLRYIENSPIFFADKINTPVLILHNDADTAVPWYQGIEFFVAMRRLNKPAWLVNYQGEPHNMRQYQNKKDFAIRMQQFFDFYLKDGAKPRWMKRGIPALEVGIEQGYELDK